MTADSRKPRIAICPNEEVALAAAVDEGGGAPAQPEVAEGLIWTDYADPEGLRATLESSVATWIQLPFAGIERFVSAGVIDPDHTWTCAKGIYGPATAEHALALMLAAARRFKRHFTARAWAPNDGERRLAGRTVLLIGTGGIGGELAAMLQPLGARLIAVNRSGRPLRAAARTESSDALPDLLPEADFVVVAAALTDETRGMLGRAEFTLMGSDAWVVNVARGGLVATDDLVDAVRAGAIGGAALDVTDPEPLPDGHPLWGLDNVIITPHVANTWTMALPELAALVRRNVAHFRRGETLEGLVDPALGY